MMTFPYSKDTIVSTTIQDNEERAVGTRQKMIFQNYI